MVYMYFSLPSTIRANTDVQLFQLDPNRRGKPRTNKSGKHHPTVHFSEQNIFELITCYHLIWPHLSFEETNAKERKISRLQEVKRNILTLTQSPPFVALNKDFLKFRVVLLLHSNANPQNQIIKLFTRKYKYICNVVYKTSHFGRIRFQRSLLVYCRSDSGDVMS